MASAFGAFENWPQNCVQYVRDGDRKCTSPSANTCSSEGVLCHLPTNHTPLASQLAPPPCLASIFVCQPRNADKYCVYVTQIHEAIFCLAQ